ncbi:MAG: GatB/YqeY domain-containing protein [Alphaproteobacteria bacterium]|nr:GatB/YqeY domain-containing protein [Alphaproteobacteria bacterium]
MLREQIKEQLVAAMKAKDEVKVSTLRMIGATLKDKDIAARPSGKTDGISDDEILSMFQTMIKQRKESIELYEKGGRSDLVAKEKAEIEIISSFLPEQMDDDAVKVAIETCIKEVGASSIKDMGKVMGALKAKYAGQMDFGKASGLIKSLLG